MSLFLVLYSLKYPKNKLMGSLKNSVNRQAKKRQGFLLVTCNLRQVFVRLSLQNSNN